MTRAKVCEQIEALGVVPVVRAPSAQIALNAVDALLAGELNVLEITLTVPDAFAVLRDVAARFGSNALIGAGTVLSTADAERAVRAGARFLVSPGFDPELVRAADALDVPVIPGVLTPTEIMEAKRAGADWLKIFPCAALGGPRYLRSLSGPFPGLKLMPTGGVNVDNAAEYIAAGAAAVGIGSELLDPKELEASQYASVSARARMLVASIREARSKAPPSDTMQRPANAAGAVTQTPSRGV